MSEFDEDEFYTKYRQVGKLDWDERKCEGANKACFLTVTQAKKAAKRYRLEYLMEYWVYQCQHCNLWHLSTSPSRNGKRVRK